MAVYTHISEDDLREFLSLYSIGSLESYKGIAEGVENTNFLLVTSEAKYILTVYEKRVNSDDLPYFLSLMEHLSQAGIPCPLPVHARDGQSLLELQGKPAAITTFLEGKWPRVIRNDNCRDVGKYLALMHNASVDFPMQRVNSMSLSAWKEMFSGVADKVDTFKAGLRQEITDNIEYLEYNWPSNLPEGVIHADVFPDNVFFREGKLSGLLDFYFACNDMFVYDIAICMNAWCFERNYEFNITKASQMLRAYTSVRALTEEERLALPALCCGAALRFLLSRLHDWLYPVEGAVVTPKDPTEYLKKLRFHRQVRGVGEYGLR